MASGSLGSLPPDIFERILLYLDKESLDNLARANSCLERRVRRFKRSQRRSSKVSHTNTKVTKESIDRKYKRGSVLPAILSAGVILTAISAIIASSIFNQPQPAEQDKGSKINFKPIDEINHKFPGLLSQRELRIIKTRLAVMQNEVSVLMLLGKSRDSHCQLDPTFCVGTRIANATKFNSYIDAADPYLSQSRHIDRELANFLAGNRNVVMVDSLEQLPASEVMKLFQFIDRNESNKRRGMILFIVYTGLEPDLTPATMKEADIAEKVLVNRWSSSIAKDTLTSVLSRICSSIVKVY